MSAVNFHIRAYPQLSSIPEESNDVLFFDQPCEDIQDETCQELALKVCKTWSELVLQRSSGFHEVFKNEKMSELVLHYTGEFHKCCKIAAKKVLVFCPPPLGKPSPQATRDPAFLVLRERILQKPQKGLTCWYYAMVMIASRIGKNPLPCQQEERALEILTSQRRKDCTKIEEVSLHRELAWHLAKKYKVVTVSKKLVLNEFLKIPDLNDKLLDKNSKFSSILETFFKQKNDDLISYTQNLYEKTSIEIDQKFLTSSGGQKTPQEFFEQEMQPIWGKNWSQLNSMEKQLIMKTFASNVCYELRGLQKSYWHPSQEIDSLIQELWLHGPHLIAANLGKDTYRDEPTLLKEKLKERKIYGWAKGAIRESQQGMSHSLIIVGADKALKRVYYIDPLDQSDPKQPNLARIYATSYERLNVNMGNLSLGMQTRDPKTNEPVFTPRKFNAPNDFALHGNPRLNYY